MNIADATLKCWIKVWDATSQDCKILCFHSTSYRFHTQNNLLFSFPLLKFDLFLSVEIWAPRKPITDDRKSNTEALEIPTHLFLIQGNIGMLHLCIVLLSFLPWYIDHDMDNTDNQETINLMGMKKKHSHNIYKKYIYIY
jgi:hypothetical protein